jgi:hypothetical protein
MDAKVESGIRTAKNTAITAAALTVVASLLMGTSYVAIAVYLLGAVLFSVCAYGISRKSSFCAATAFSLSIAVAVYNLPFVLIATFSAKPWVSLSEFASFTYIATTVVYTIIAIILYQGIWATIVYHDRADRFLSDSIASPELEAIESSAPLDDDSTILPQ